MKLKKDLFVFTKVMVEQGNNKLSKAVLVHHNDASRLLRDNLGLFSPLVVFSKLVVETQQHYYEHHYTRSFR